MRPRLILQFDHDATAAGKTQQALREAGLKIEFHVVADAGAFRDSLDRESYDLALVGGTPSDLDYRAALDITRRHRADLPVLCLAEAWEDNEIDALVVAGATQCLRISRPVQLVAAVRHLLDCQHMRREAARLDRMQAASARLVAAVQELSHARDFDSIRRIVRHAARELTGADGATLVLRDRDQCHYVDEDAISPLWKGKRFPLSACISGWSMLHRQSVVIEDIYADERIPADAYRPTFVKSLLMVPIRSDDPLGAIGNYWAFPHEADPREIELLEALANTTAVALENVRIYEELEQRVQDRTRLLQAANKELETFSFSVSHDLRSPLHAIASYAELLAETEPAPSEDERTEFLARIRKQTTRMGRLIEDFLRLAQVTRADLKPEPVDLVQIAKGLLPQLQNAAADRRVEFVHPPTLPASGDPQLLQAALQNLFANAWKYTGRRPSDARIELGRIDSAEGLPTFFVRDNGAGFDPEQSARLFTPFQRLHSDKEFPGSGVGLATVHRIIHKHGGRIWAEGKPNEGATFYFTLAPGPAA